MSDVVEEFNPVLHIERDVPNEKHGMYAFTINLGDGYSRCCLKAIGNGQLETHSRLSWDLTGQGYGVLLYSHTIRFALDGGYRVCSSKMEEMTFMARRLWESRRLRQEFEICRDRDRFWVMGLRSRDGR